MLNVNKKIALNGTSVIENKTAAYFNATVGEESQNNDNINMTIADKSLYDANKQQVQADFAEFCSEFYSVQGGE